MNYKNLEIWQLSKQLVLEIHDMTFELPKFEQFEEAQQIRRSIKSVKSNIVEGFGRRKYKSDFVRFLVIANASLDESIDHLENLYETRSLSKQELFDSITLRLNILGKKLINFIKAVEQRHNSFNA
jgi:four helix bundle protein